MAFEPQTSYSDSADKPPDTSPDEPARQTAPRTGALLLGLVLAALTIILIIQLEVVQGSEIYFSTTSVAVIPLSLLFVVQLGNSYIRKAWPRIALNTAELLCIYVLTATAAFIAGFDFLQGLLSILSYGSWYPYTDEGTRHSVLSALPHWATVRDPLSVKTYYLGGGNLLTDFRASVWLVPLAFWTAFAVVLLWTLICLARIMEGYWSKHQRLSFPLAELPVVLSDPDNEVRKARAFKLGFLLGALLVVLPALHHELPSFPAPLVPIGRMTAIDIGAMYQNPPMNAMGYTPLFVSPFIVGLAFMAPLDMQFSCWFFVIFWRLLRIGTAALGYVPGGRWGLSGAPPFSGEQTLGALLFLGVLSLWQARGWIRNGLRLAFSRRNAGAMATDTDPSVYQGAAVGICLLFVMERAIGMPSVFALVSVVLFLIISVAAARIRAEVGAPIHDFSNLGPDFVMAALLPSRALSPQLLGAFTMNHWFGETWRANLLAVGSENFRIGSRVNVRSSIVLKTMLGGAVFAVILFIFYYLRVAYRSGAEVGMHGYSASGMSQRSIQTLTNWLASDKPLPSLSWVWIGIGSAVAYALYAIRCVLPWWPLHVAGFALSSQWAGTMLWGSFFVAWAIKWCVLHAGGLRLYRRVIPLMMGLVSAQLVVGVAWAVADLVLGHPIYGFCDH